LVSGVGKKGAFTPAQVKGIRQVLMARGVSGLRDLALFQVAIDTMLHGPDLFNLTVKDVQLPNGKIRSIIKVARRGEMLPVRCAFSKTTASALGKWIAEKALHIWKGTGDLEMVRMLLGHAKIESTARFLRVPTASDPMLNSRAFDI
jgi:site-specific recombinase XerD